MTQTPPTLEKPTMATKPRLQLVGLLFGIGLIALVVGLVNTGPLKEILEKGVSLAENQYQQWLSSQDTGNPLILLPSAFIGGLIASVSPCVLALLPLNLSYIGTREITSRRDAFTKASLFVLGVVTVLSFFGLFSAFAGAVLVEYRGFIYLAVGGVILFMSLSLLNIVRLPLPQLELQLPIAGSYGVGLTFALVSSPCASPVLFAVLAAAAASGSQVLGTLIMVSYALGYTVIIFFSSLFAGLARRTRGLLEHSEWIVRISSLVLLVGGGYYLWAGVSWFL